MRIDLYRGYLSYRINYSHSNRIWEFESDAVVISPFCPVDRPTSGKARCIAARCRKPEMRNASKQKEILKRKNGRKPKARKCYSSCPPDIACLAMGMVLCKYSYGNGFCGHQQQQVETMCGTNKLNCWRTQNVESVRSIWSHWQGTIQPLYAGLTRVQSTRYQRTAPITHRKHVRGVSWESWSQL